MRLAKKILIFIVGLCVVLAFYIAIGSIDSDTFDDQRLLGNLRNIPPSKNAYTDLAYVYSTDFKSDLDPLAQTLNKHILGEKWDDTFVKQTLKNHRKIIEDVTTSTQKPYLQVPIPPTYTAIGNYLTIDAPSYHGYTQINSLLLLSGMQSTKNGDMASAISNFSTAIKFGELFKHSDNRSLISYVIGLYIEHRTVDSILMVVNERHLSSAQYKLFIDIFDEVSAYEKDGFENVFSGELSLMFLSINNISNKNIVGRLSDYNKVIHGPEYEMYGPKRDYFLFALLPKFYLHNNTSITKTAMQFSQKKNQSTFYCKDIKEPDNDSIDISKWYAPFIPGMLDEFHTFPKQYFNRRCLTQVAINSTKTALAVYAYKTDTGKYPDSLDVLVPNYLSQIPIDVFDGKPLRYSAKNKWIYSVGEDFVDDGGSAKTVMSFGCHHKQICRNNPTLPLE